LSHHLPLPVTTWPAELYSRDPRGWIAWRVYPFYCVLFITILQNNAILRQNYKNKIQNAAKEYYYISSCELSRMSNYT
jgi:hypothetical protein